MRLIVSFSTFLSVFMRPQGDGQTRDPHGVTPGHNNGELTARNVVTDAAHATHDGPSVSRERDGRVLPTRVFIYLICAL